MANIIDRLAPYLKAPVQQDAIVAFIDKAGRPVRGCEVVEGTGIPLSKVDRALRRLADKGFLTRMKLPMTLFVKLPHSGRAVVPYTRRVWLYSLAAPAE